MAVTAQQNIEFTRGSQEVFGKATTGRGLCPAADQ
jgi:hypothetical protein